MAVDQSLFRAAMSRLPTGVTVLTTPVGGAGHEVMTANAVTSVSLEPTLLLASVKSSSRWLSAVVASGVFAVNVLAAHQEELARWCAGSARHERPEVLLQHGVRVSSLTGALVLEESVVTIECRVHSQVPAGDHVLVLGEVLGVHVQDGDTPPLLFVDRGYGSAYTERPRLHPVYPAAPEVPAAAAFG